MALPTTRMPVVITESPDSEVAVLDAPAEETAAKETETDEVFTPAAAPAESLDIFTDTPTAVDQFLLATETDRLILEEARKEVASEEAAFAAQAGTDDPKALAAIKAMKEQKEEEGKEGWNWVIKSSGALSKEEAAKEAKEASRRTAWTAACIVLSVLAILCFAGFFALGGPS